MPSSLEFTAQFLRDLLPLPVMKLRTREQRCQACRVTRVGRYTVDCVRHGRVSVDEMTYPNVCPFAGEGKQ